MKPDTIELFTCLACAEAKKNIDEFVHLDAATINSNDLRMYAITCSDIIAIYEALENFLLTAADEADRIEAAADDMVAADNIQIMTEEEHSESHNFKGGRYA